MAICIYSSAGIRCVRSARCKATLSTDLAYRTALCSIIRNRSVVAVTLLGVLTLEIWYISGGADCLAPGTSYLFSVLPFPPLPILWNVAFLTCIFSKCCLQYASVRQAGIIFQAVNWFLLVYIPERKGPLLVVSVIKHTFTAPRIRSFCTLYARQTIIN